MEEVQAEDACCCCRCCDSGSVDLLLLSQQPLQAEMEFQWIGLETAELLPAYITRYYNNLHHQVNRQTWIMVIALGRGTFPGGNIAGKLWEKWPGHCGVAFDLCFGQTLIKFCLLFWFFGAGSPFVWGKLEKSGRENTAFSRIMRSNAK